MAVCSSCGTDNIDGTRFCVTCGTTLTPAPAPGDWRSSGDLNATQVDDQSGSAPGSSGYQPQTPPSPASYAPPPPPPSNYPTYTPPQNISYQPTTGQSQSMHPAVPALVSFFFPGLGLLFVPNKAGFGIAIFALTIGYAILAFILSFVFIGFCLFLVMPIINIVAAIHSWDEAAKTSNGQFQPILFK